MVGWELEIREWRMENGEWRMCSIYDICFLFERSSRRMKIFGWQRKLNNDLRYAVVLLKANGQQLIANSLRRKVPVGLHRELNNDLSYAVV